jgi:hypothetical protein
MILSNQKYLKEFTFLHAPKQNDIKNNHINTSIDVLYEGLPVAAQSILKLQTYKCQGPYGADFSKRGAEGGNPWHPGVKGHRYRAHSLSYFILKALSQAILDIKAVIGPIQSTTSASKSPIYRATTSSWSTYLYNINIYKNANYNSNKALTILKTKCIEEIKLLNGITILNIPEKTIGCEAEICMNSEPKCYTNYLPREDSPLISIDTLGRSIDNTPITSFLRNIETSYSLTGQIIGTTNWTIDLSFYDKKAVMKGETKGFGYQDRKILLFSPKKDIFISNNTYNNIVTSSITLEVDISYTNASKYQGMVWLCELQKGFLQYPSEYGDLDDESYITVTPKGYSLKDFINNNNNNNNNTKLLKMEKTYDYCYKLKLGKKKGKQWIHIWPKSDKRISIAYMISW